MHIIILDLIFPLHGFVRIKIHIEILTSANLLVIANLRMEVTFGIQL
jgi:hypothetical protein